MSVSELSGEVVGDYMLPLADEDVQPGDIWDGEVWTRPDTTPDEPPPKTPEQLLIEQLQQQIAEANDANLTTMSALADVFEQVLSLQDQLAALQGTAP